MPPKIRTTPFVAEIKQWLDTMTDDYVSASDNETELAIKDAVRMTGYGTPFDREQRGLNQLLKEKRANRLACLTAWAYYHDFKIANVKSLAFGAA